MVSARWVITATLLLGVLAVGIGYARYFRARQGIPRAQPSTAGTTPLSLSRVRCDPEHVVADATPPDVRAIEAQLYEQVVRSTYRERFPLVVESVAIPTPVDASGPRGDEFFNALPRELASRALSSQSATDCSEQTLDRFPAGTILVPQERVVRVSRPQRVPSIDWTRFQERFPGTKALFAFSRAVMTSDGLNALLYYDRFCPDRCGEGEYVWFRRTSARDSWHVVKKQWLWLS